MATVLRANFPDWLSTSALPFIREAIDWGRKLRPEWFPQVFRMETTDRPFEQYTSYTRFGQFVQTDENSPVTYDSPMQGFDKTLTPLQYSLGFKVSRIAFDDDKLGPLRNLASGLGESYTDGRNILSADIFNNGFSGSFTGADGVSLFSASHLREDGVTFRNQPSAAADISITSFRTAMIDFRNFRDGRGKRLNLIPEWVMTAPDNWFDTAEILMSGERPDTANRATNVTNKFFGGNSFNIILNDYLTDTDAWFLGASKENHGLIFLEREAFNVQADVDFDTRALKHAGWGRYSVDWINNGIGLYGSAGA